MMGQQRKLTAKGLEEVDRKLTAKGLEYQLSLLHGKKATTCGKAGQKG